MGNLSDVVFCGQVTSCSVSSDGLQVCASTSTGSLGVLDIPSHAYRTLLRSHAGAVTAAAFDPSPDRDEVSLFYNLHMGDCIDGACFSFTDGYVLRGWHRASLGLRHG